MRPATRSTATTNLTVDTIAPTVAITTIEGGDNLINATEAAGGIQISGTAEIGSTLTVNGSAVTVDGTGHWTTSITPAGQGALVVTAVATDAAGNSARPRPPDGRYRCAGGCDHQSGRSGQSGGADHYRHGRCRRRRRHRHHLRRLSAGRQRHRAGQRQLEQQRHAQQWQQLADRPGHGSRRQHRHQRSGRLYAEHQRSGGDRDPGVRYRDLDARPHHLERCAERDRPCQHGGAFYDRRQRDRRHRDRRRPGRMVVHADRAGRWATHHRGEPDRHVRQHRHGLAELHARHRGACGGDHHHRRRRQPHQCGGSGRRHPDQWHGGDRLDADGERCGGDGGRYRALDHVDNAGGPGCAGGDGGGDRCGRQLGDAPPPT